MRVSVLCIDAAPNSFLANDLAERGGGSVYYLTSDPGEKALALVLDEIMEEWKSPVLSNLCLEITANGIQTNRNYNIRNQGDCEIIEIGDLVSGRSKWVVGRFLRDNLQNIKFRLLNEHGSELVNWEMVNNPDDQTHPQIKSLFGAGWLLRLEDILQKAAYKETCAQAKLDLLQMGFGTTDSIGTSLEGNSLYRENKGKALQDAVRKSWFRNHCNSGCPVRKPPLSAYARTRKKIEKTVVIQQCSSQRLA